MKQLHATGFTGFCTCILLLTGSPGASAQAPVWVSKPVTHTLAGQLYEYLLLAPSPSGGPTEYQALEAPDWLTLEEANAPRIYTIAGTTDRGPSDPLQAQLGFPTLGAYDAAGNLYFSDSSAHCVWKLDTNGTLTVVAGIGVPGFSGDGGLATRAHLFGPAGVAVDPQGNVYVADQLNNRIRRINPAGHILTVAGDGEAGFAGDGGPALAARLNYPESLAWGPDGRLYVADTFNHRIRVIDQAGIISTVAGTGEAGYSGDGGPAREARLRSPRSLCLLPDGTLLIADSANSRLRRVDAEGNLQTVAGLGEPGMTGDGGSALAARLFLPVSVVATAEAVWMVDSFDNRIRYIATADGIIRTVPGTGGGGAVAARGLAAGVNAGPVTVLEGPNRRVSRVNASGLVSTLAGGGAWPPAVHGQLASRALLLNPHGILPGPEGEVYIAETEAHRVLRLNPDQTLTVLAGTGVAGFSGDGGPGTSAQLNSPTGLVLDAAGNLYISDSRNNRVRRLSPTGIITTFAGGGVGEGSGDGGPATQARLFGPRGLAFDSAGHLYIVEQGINRIRRVALDGIITTVAGLGQAGFSGDGGPAVNARIWAPDGLTVDEDGHLFFADTFNHRVRRIAPDGIITTVAGTGVPGYEGDGGPALQARLHYPRGVVVAPDGALYVGDSLNHRIRRIRPDGRIETVAGGPVANPDFGGHSGDGGSPLVAELAGPTDVKLTALGELIFADSNLGLIRRIFQQGRMLRGTPPADARGAHPVRLEARSGPTSSTQTYTLIVETLPVITRPPQAVEVRPGENADFEVEAEGTGPLSYQWLRNGALLSDSGPYTGTATARLSIDGVSAAETGVYQVRVLGPAGSVLSEPVTLTLDLSTPPVITQQPESLNRRIGESVTFRVSATGTEPLSYQWFKDDTALSDSDRISGSATAELELRDLTGEDAGAYRVVVSNRAGSVTSQSAQLTVDTRLAPSIVEAPRDLTVEAGADAQFSVVAAGTEPLSYQWLRNGAPLINSGRIQGATSPALTLRGARPSDIADYAVRVANAVGSVTSAVARLTVLPPVPPTITRQPAPQSVQPGGAATFTVEAAGTPPLSYQWLKDGVPVTDSARLTGTRTDTLQILDATPEDVGEYSVTVGNLAGAVTSNPARLSLAPAQPPFLTLPALGGELVRFRVSGTPGLSCQVQGSSDLQTWTVIQTVVLTESGVEVFEPAGAGPRFYRAVIP